MIRTSKLYFNKANTNKLNNVTQLLDESKRVINLYIDKIWEENSLKKLKYINFKIDTWLSARMQQALGKQALEIVRSQRKKKKQTKPAFNKEVITLDNRFFKFEFDKNTFDVWVIISSIGNKIKLVLPAKKHKHFNQLLNDNWKIKNSIRLHKDYIDVIFEKEFQFNNKNKVVGIDCGYKKLFITSDNQKVGNNLTYYAEKIAKKTQGSKAFKRALIERNNYINQEINKLNLKDVGVVVCENLKNVKKGTKGKIQRKTMNKLQRWVYSKAIKKLELFCEVNGVHIYKINPAYTSQTCSKCGAVDKKSRKGEIFECTSCGNRLDADYNASLNISMNFLGSGVYSPCEYKI